VIDDEPRSNSPEDIGGPFGWTRPSPAQRPPREHATTNRRDTMAATNEEPKTKEGPRGFSVLLQQVQDGELHGELSAEVQKLVSQLGDHALKFQRPSKGSLTLVLNFTAVGATVEVVGEVKVKAPKNPRQRSVFWATPGGNLSVDNPRQTKLPLREVPPASHEQPRDVGTPGAAPRSV